MYRVQVARPNSIMVSNVTNFTRECYDSFSRISLMYRYRRQDEATLKSEEYRGR